MEDPNRPFIQRSGCWDTPLGTMQRAGSAGAAATAHGQTLEQAPCPFATTSKIGGIHMIRKRLLLGVGGALTFGLLAADAQAASPGQFAPHDKSPQTNNLLTLIHRGGGGRGGGRGWGGGGHWGGHWG